MTNSILLDAVIVVLCTRRGVYWPFEALNLCMFFVYVTFAGFSRFLTFHWTVRLIRGEWGFIFFVVFVNGRKSIPFLPLSIVEIFKYITFKVRLSVG